MIIIVTVGLISLILYSSTSEQTDIKRLESRDVYITEMDGCADNMLDSITLK